MFRLYTFRLRDYIYNCAPANTDTTTMATSRLLPHILSADFLLRATIASLLCWRVSAWGDSSSDTSIYGNSLSRDWLYSSNAISMQLEGCMWGYVADNEDSGCMENESEDGTTYWYQMANCRRAQAVFSLYASSSGNSASCSSNTFKESVRLSHFSA